MSDQLDIDNILLDEEVVAPAAPKPRRKSAKAAPTDLTNPLDVMTEDLPKKSTSDLTPEELAEIMVLRGKIIDYKATFAEDLKEIKTTNVAECCDIDVLEDKLNQIRIKLSSCGGGNQWASMYYFTVGGIESATMKFCPNTIMLEGLTNTLSMNPQVNRCLQEMRIEHGNYLGSMTPELRLLQATLMAAWVTNSANSRRAAEAAIEKTAPAQTTNNTNGTPLRDNVAKSDFFSFDSTPTSSLEDKYRDI